MDIHSKKEGSFNSQARYLINQKKRIVIKKVKALSLLKDLHISVYDINLNGESQNRVHFKDVLKSLL